MKPGTFTQMYVMLVFAVKRREADTVYHIKRGSSLFINNGKLCPCHFSWQEGYGAFTYNRSQLDDLYNYVKNQEQHHASVTFRKEYVEFLEQANIDYDERFLFEFIDDE